jgi:intein/homing endonuclease
MLAGYMFGDGCFIKAARTNGISIEAQYQILIMLVKLGYLAHIRKIKRKKGKEQFGIDLSAFESKKLLKEFFKYDELEFVFEDKRKELKESNHPAHTHFKTENYISSIIRNIEEIDYEGKVYNLEVEDDNSYVANGVIVHNCDAERYMIFTHLHNVATYRVRWL